MFLALNHSHLDVFRCSRELTLSCYQVTKIFPESERYILVNQIKRAALSVHLNLSEGCSRKSKKERIRFNEISRGSVIEIDTAFDVALSLNYINRKDLEATGILLNRVFSMLSAMMKDETSNVKRQT